MRDGSTACPGTSFGLAGWIMGDMGIPLPVGSLDDPFQVIFRARSVRRRPPAGSV
jgi:hypothetical protein